MKAFILSIIFCLLTACGTSPKVNNYLLHNEYADDIAVIASDAPKVLMKSFILAEYLNRPQIVSRKGQVAIEVDEFNRWAEPLKTLFIGAFNEAMLQQAINMSQQKQFRDEQFDYQLNLHVMQFEVSDKQQAHLKVKWQLLNASGSQALMSHIEIINVPVAAGKGFDQKVKAQSQAIDLLSSRIANKIKARSGLHTRQP